MDTGALPRRVRVRLGGRSEISLLFALKRGECEKNGFLALTQAFSFFDGGGKEGVDKFLWLIC